MLDRNIWVGEKYASSSPKILILGESDYGGTEPLQDYLPTWFDGKADPTFTRIFNAFSGLNAAKASPADRKEFWGQYVFYNFVVGDVGPTAKHRPKIAAYLASQEPLKQVLSEYAPQGVIVLGIEQSEYSQPVLAQCNITHVVSPHPAWRQLKTPILTGKWDELKQMLHASG